MFKILSKIKRVFYRFYNRSSSSRFVKFLRENGVSVGSNVFFREPFTTAIDMTRPSLISFGNNIDINEHFTIMTHDFGTFVFRNLYNDFVASSGRVELGNNIYIGRNVTILKGCTIGDNCIIGLGSVVTKSIPANSVACGVPCKVICTIDEYYEKRKNAQVAESIDFGVSIIERYNREPVITDFKEEWCVFMDRNIYDKHPETHEIVDFRIKHNTHFFDSRQPVFRSFEDFLEAIRISYKSKHNIEDE